MTALLLAVCAAVILTYAGWQLRNLWWWQRLPATEGLAAETGPFISVVVPYRNEGANLTRLLRSLAAQDYPRDRWELLLIDDFSTDISRSGALNAGAGEVAAAAMKVQTLALADHYAEDALVAHKKAALALGIQRSSGEVIFTTDADCDLPPDLLRRLARSFRPDTEVVLGPVFNAPVVGFCAGFQALDLMAYQFLTGSSLAAGTPTLANGACFAFRRRTFERVGGYAGVDHLPSGDDVLLLHKFRAALSPAAFAWLETGVPVFTQPVVGWRALWMQRLRWAGKAGQYRAKELEFAQALTFLCCLAVIALLFLALHLRSGAPLLLWLPKIAVDGLGLRAIARRYGQTALLRWYPPTLLLYPFFLVAVGTAALLGFRVGWKGRG
ncbi:glycosyltransferase [Neolewinella lacunae]|uniref:Glycosyltransferase n=1 Tax=Neolewinella lacunae TaxID=1517758 RepID=A0A923TBY1_9BACT|nr:glycosyltransferase [Neolewinella lacunae]MBC6993117.1 glycosyltransferase [Neolewinella lacunae]MDN3635937.1 glycosyltransferase [Neolewinella lacunae]